jgi:hypothetical protein
MSYRGNYGRPYDASAIDKLLSIEIKRSKLSRQEIADGMSSKLGKPVTLRMMNSYTSGAAEQHRWPAEFDIAFCEVVGSYRLLQERIKRAGFRMVGPNEERLIAIGKAYEQKLDAELILAGRGL